MSALPVDNRRISLASPDLILPGLGVLQQISASHQPSPHKYEGVNALPSHSGSIYSLSDHDTYDPFEDWTELRNLPSSKNQDSDAKNPIEHRIRRASSVSSSSSTSTVVHQTWEVRWLNSIGKTVAAFWTLPIIRHVLRPFQWFENEVTRGLPRSRFQGWRMGLLLGCCISSIVLCLNLAVLIFIAIRGDGFQKGFAVPWTGSAEDMSWYNRAIHVAINALSTILLGASNYTMQVLSSPTRKDIDKAHAKSEHLDVGFLSTRNLSRIPKRRLLLFLIMGFSSIPIHLFYNSALFYIGANNQYDIHLVEVGSDIHRTFYETNTPKIYDKITGSQWIRMYDNAFVSSGDLILAVDEYRLQIDNTTQTGKPLGWPNVDQQTIDTWNKDFVPWNLTAPRKYNGPSPRSFLKNITGISITSKEWIQMNWMFGGTFVENSKINPDTNPPTFAHVSHVFVKRIEATASRIQASLTFLVIVIVCNFVKLLTMVWVVFMERKDYIVTLGDGAASFLEHRDSTTERMCSLSKKEIILEVAAASFRHHDELERLVMDSKMTWNKRFSTYSNARNKDREVGTYFIFLVNVTLFILFITILALRNGRPGKWGTASVTTFRETDTSSQQTLLNAWLANAPQLVLSFCYLAINSECTAMAGAAEWNNLASSHKGLRVTKPVGKQRDTYFLQLPYRWALPLMIFSGGLHWLLSQSVFLVRIDEYTREGKPVIGRSTSACGFSGTSWLTLTGCFWLLVGTMIVIGHKKIKMRLPFAASCSLVISAACHAPKNDVNAHLKSLKWGVVEERMFEGELHCALSSGKVTRPREGVKYL